MEAGIGRHIKRSLLETLRGIRQLQSEDLRDRVFGTLATTDWKGGERIQPDYDKDRFDLAIEVLQTITAQGRFGDTLLSATIEVAKLLGLPDQPSSRLADEIQMRRLTQLKVPCVDPARIAQRRFLRSELCWGYRIYFHNARWQLQPPPSKYAPVNRSVPNPQR